MRAINVGEGGAPPVVTVTGRGSRRAPGWLTSMVWTVGAPLKWVISPCSRRSQTRAGSTLGRQTLVPPTAASAQVKHQPLQWNIGKVQRYRESERSRVSITIARAFRYAPRWWYITPFGCPVVPEV